MKRNVLITGVDPYNGNRGVAALAYSMLYAISSIDPDGRISVYLYNVSRERDVLTIGEKRCAFENIRTVDFFSLKGFLLTVFNSLRYRGNLGKYLKIDIVLDMGEGDSFSDIYGVARFNLINNSKRTACLLRKPLVILPQTIGPYNDEKCRKLATTSLERASCVFTRDVQSTACAESLSRRVKTIEVIDVAFMLPYTRRSHDAGKVHVGLNVSSLLWHGGYTKDNQFGLVVDYRRLTKSVLSRFLAVEGVVVHLIPHVVLSMSDIENDYEIAYEIANSIKDENLVLSPFFLDPVEAKSYISGMDFFVGARMHSCIAAISSGVPVYPLAYSRKFNGLFADTLKYGYLGDLKNEAEGNVIEGLFSAFDKRDAIRRDIEIVQKKIVDERCDKFRRLLGDCVLGGKEGA